MKRLLVLATAASALSQAPTPSVKSIIVTVRADGTDERLVGSFDGRYEAPNWSRGGDYLLINSGGKLWKLPVAGGTPAQVDTGSVRGINNDHGISPDGRSIVISARQMYILPEAGGTPRQLTANEPSYFHGWSPDGRRLAYCAPRDKNFDLYDIAVDGGAERRLTSHAGYDDGPDYSPDGRWIYFNSDRSGSWDVWRIPPDGAGAGDARAERITADEYEDWFPHPSPDGKWIVFLSFAKGTQGHPPDQNIMLRRIPVVDGRPDAARVEVIARMLGGQGTINVNSWSPDSSRFAFIRYKKDGG